MAPARRIAIGVFVAAWLFVFNYESLRYNYLGRWLGADLPKVRWLFPPAGWIMFYRVDGADGRAEVYGRKGAQAELIDPHRIFATRWVGYDNIHRNVLITVLRPAYAGDFCRYLRRKFPEYDGFVVMEAWVPSVVEKPQETVRQLAYRCP